MSQLNIENIRKRLQRIEEENDELNSFMDSDTTNQKKELYLKTKSGKLIKSDLTLSEIQRKYKNIKYSRKIIKNNDTITDKIENTTDDKIENTIDDNNTIREKLKQQLKQMKNN